MQKEAERWEWMCAHTIARRCHVSVSELLKQKTAKTQHQVRRPTPSNIVYIITAYAMEGQCTVKTDYVVTCITTLGCN